MDNPYQAPATASPLASTDHEISPDVIRALGGTKGWVRFLGVLGFVGTAFIFIASLGLLMGAGRMGSHPFAPGLLAGIYVGAGVLYFFAAFKLNHYASKIGVFISQASQAHLADALEAQRGFWKYVGICALVMIVLYVLTIVLVAARFVA
jgi:hypothetical protein